MTTPRRAWTILAALLLPACGGGDRSAGDRSGSGSGDTAAPRAEAALQRDAGEAPAAPGGRVPLRDPVPLVATADIDGTRYRYSGIGECQHTDDASIYEIPASMWSARFADETGTLSYLNLTLWQPKGAAAVQVSLALTGGRGTSEISTVKGAEAHGSGSGRVDPKGEGGSLVVDGRDADGHGVKLTVDCSRFTEPVAEGG